MAIIAILIFTIFFRLNKINVGSYTSSATKNTELDKNLEKKLTGIQIRLNEIMTEISMATNEQKESLSKVATKVAAAAAAAAPADSIAYGAASSAATTTTTTYTAKEAIAATVATTAIPSATSISSLTLTNPFASTALPTHGLPASSANTSAIYANPARIVSGLFERSNDTHTPRSEFLDIDLDNESSDTSNNNLDSLDSKLQDQDDILVPTNVIHAISDASKDMLDPVASSSSNSYQHAETSSRHHHYHPLTHNYLNHRQDTDLAQSELTSRFVDPDLTIQRDKEIDDNDNDNNRVEEDLFQNQNDNNDIKDFENKKLPSTANEKNSNPELDKIDEEILTALQRLGGINESDNDKDKSNDISNNK